MVVDACVVCMSAAMSSARSGVSTVGSGPCRGEARRSHPHSRAATASWRTASGGGGECRRRKALQAERAGASVSISNLESRCPDFGGAASDVFRTKRDKGVGRLRKFTAFCIENGISLACSLSLSHPSSKSQTPKAKRNLRHLRSHAFPLETHTERRED